MHSVGGGAESEGAHCATCNGVGVGLGTAPPCWVRLSSSYLGACPALQGGNLLRVVDSAGGRREIAWSVIGLLLGAQRGPAVADTCMRKAEGR